MKVRNEQGWYVAELHGVCYLTWVSPEDKERAAYFPDDAAERWLALLADMTEQKLTAE